MAESTADSSGLTGIKRWDADEMANHVARDLPDGAVVNLGIGLPTRVARHVAAEKEVIFHSENGMLGVGPPSSPETFDEELIDAGKNHVTLLAGGSYFSHVESFAMIRGGHVDISVMGAFEVAQNGDLANWTVPAEKTPAVGGAMDLAVGAKRVVVIMRHQTEDGRRKIVSHCSYPLTARAVVSRVYTDLATFDIENELFHVVETVPGLTEADLRRVTDGEVAWPEAP